MGFLFLIQLHLSYGNDRLISDGGVEVWCSGVDRWWSEINCRKVLSRDERMTDVLNTNSLPQCWQQACGGGNRVLITSPVATAGYLHHLTPGPEKSFLFYLFLLQVSRHLTFHLFSFSFFCSLYCHRLCICVCHAGAAALQSVSDLSFCVFIWFPAQVQHPVFLSLCFCCCI